MPGSENVETHVLWQRAIQSEDVATVRALIAEHDELAMQCVQKFRQDGSWFLLDPLCEAAHRDCIEICQVLLDAGKDPNRDTTGLSEYRDGRDGAYCLAWAGSQQTRDFLVAAGADANTLQDVRVPFLDWETIETGWNDEDGKTSNDLGWQWQRAIEELDIHRVRDLLEHHPHLLEQKLVERNNHWPHDALFTVAGKGDLPLVRLLVESGYDPVMIRECIPTASVRVVPYLLDHCESAPIPPEIGLMAYCGRAEDLAFWLARGHQVHGGMLHDACCGRGGFRGFFRDDHHAHWPVAYREVVRLLIAHGADVNQRNEGGNKKYDGAKPWVMNRETPLHFAAGSWDRNIIQQLLDAGADRSVTNDNGETAFDWSIRYSAPQEIADLLDFDGNPRRNDALVEACHAGDIESVRRMVENGADPNSCDANGAGTLLTFHPNVLSYLLEQGADPNFQRNESTAPVLIGHVYVGNIDCIRLLVQAGANPNRANEHNHETALHYAVAGDNIELVQLLLDAGSEPNAKTKPRMSTRFLWRDARVRGETPLHRAAAWGSADVIRLLLKHGANPKTIDINKDTPLSYASWHMRETEVVDLLSYEGSGIGPDLRIGGEPA